MKPQRRFIASALKTAKSEMPQLPFQRGAQRKAFIAKRETTLRTVKSA